MKYKVISSGKSLIVPLQKDEHEICETCNGTGYVMESADLHHSAGVIPCPNLHCKNGKVITTYMIIEKPRVRVKSDGSRYKWLDLSN